MPQKNKEERQAYHREYYKRLKNGEMLARGTRPVKNILGQKFDKLTAIVFDSRRGFLQRPYWVFQCDCGSKKVLAAADVIAGKTRACGCVKPSGRPPYLEAGEGALRSLYLSYSRGAKSRNLEFNLTIEHFRNLTKGSCGYCGTEPLQISTGSSRKMSPYLYNGVDRVDNLKGYIEGNVVPCCIICNQAKHSLSLEEFMSWVKRLVSFQNRESGAVCAGRN